ncbi:hypothetical protein [Desulfosediminicola sp.]|uniref:hypothetical protein n=1 Tax=Desulfosediminicola sp. TaxID=2886825 RepID=UPI003AF2A0ED
MNYIILITLLLTLIAIITGVIFAFKKIRRVYFFLILIMVIASPIVVFKIYERDFKISVVPDALQVSSISYVEEKSSGFGPGCNGAGIRVYPLSEKIANQITKRGMEYFNHLPENKNQQKRRWRGRYDSWNETPVKEDRFWKQKEGGDLLLYDYICRYGFCINIDEKVVGQATDIINSEGNYYAYGRIGLIVVSPSKKLVIYMYNG